MIEAAEKEIPKHKTCLLTLSPIMCSCLQSKKEESIRSALKRPLHWSYSCSGPEKPLWHIHAVTDHPAARHAVTISAVLCAFHSAPTFEAPIIRSSSEHRLSQNESIWWDEALNRQCEHKGFCFLKNEVPAGKGIEIKIECRCYE